MAKQSTKPMPPKGNDGNLQSRDDLRQPSGKGGVGAKSIAAESMSKGTHGLSDVEMNPKKV